MEFLHPIPSKQRHLRAWTGWHCQHLVLLFLCMFSIPSKVGVWLSWLYFPAQCIQICVYIWMRVVRWTVYPALHAFVSVNDMIGAATSPFLIFVCFISFISSMMRNNLDWLPHTVISHSISQLKHKLRFRTGCGTFGDTIEFLDISRFYKHTSKWSLMTSCRTHHADNHRRLFATQQRHTCHSTWNVSEVMKTHISFGFFLSVYLHSRQCW